VLHHPALIICDERRIRDDASNGGETTGLTAFLRYFGAELRSDKVQKMANIALTLPIARDWTHRFLGQPQFLLLLDDSNANSPVLQQIYAAT
jgi:hypothetical protein